ncbi:MAG: thiamine phosphate synthase, partial [Rikenellaceae bacterium]|nr:thiamine phosphate synthase [Rikenellaceae bacterium]
PDADINEIAKLVDSEYREACTIHYREELSKRLGCGIHCRREDIARLREESPDAVISCSCHSVDEISEASGADYLFLSPIFDSISKQGYSSNFDLEQLSDQLKCVESHSEIIALGGVSVENIHKIEVLGFDGWAALGSAWEVADGCVDVKKSIEKLNRLTMKDISKLQYITRGKTQSEVLAESEAVLKGGCRWIQLRMKDTDNQTIVETGAALRTLCHSYGAIFIVNDSPERALAVDADGVHLGRQDMPVAEARKIMNGKIIGATANTLDDIIATAEAGADYIGLGPYRYTDTKKNLSPILGLERVSEIVRKVRAQGHNIPIVTIGGITVEDCPDIVASGVTGIAISGAIGDSEDPETATRQFLEGLKN